MFIFVTESLYKLWLKLTYVAIILFVLSVLFTEVNPSGWGLSNASREVELFFVGSVYVLISWLIALWGFLKKGK